MALAVGTRLGPYEIVAAIGAGGMGEVHRARDTKLHRDVAIKVLLPAVANDPERLARFRREAQVLASLNHPNIAQVHGIEDATGVPALVMELVEGPTLAERIEGLRAGTGLPLIESLVIAKQIADALEAAHEQGIVHRDLKPANIKVRDDGTVKVLDFGLAKAIDPASAAGISATMSPTLSMRATQAGIILGTAAYMSPEQAAGKAVDKRSDLWAFGVVLFEMLAGRALFTGETVSHVLASVLKTDPDWNALPAETPAPIRRLLRRCLEKDRKRRLDSAAAARLEVDEALSAPASLASGGDRRQSSRRSALSAIAIFVAGGIVIGASVWAITKNSHAAAPAAVVRFAIHDTDRVIVSRAEGDMALSPDGRTLAFVGYGEGGARIWIRTLDSLEARPLHGSEGATAMAWLPDGRTLAFAADRRVKKVVVPDGTPESVTPALVNQIVWLASAADGTILFGDSLQFLTLPASGGTPKLLRRSSDEEARLSPEFLPDGRHYLYSVRSAESSGSGTFATDLDGSARVRLLAIPTPAHYASGRLLYVRDRVLYAQPFDLSRLQFAGDPVPLSENVVANFSVSNSGTVVYSHADDSVVLNSGQLQWRDRKGHVLERIEQAAGASRPALSPDGRRLAVGLRSDVWVLDVARGVLSRLTSHVGSRTVGSATWSADGQRLIFFRNAFRNGHDVLVEGAVGSPGEETILHESGRRHAHPTDVSADGRYVVYDGEEDGQDIWILRLTSDRKASPYVQTPSIETQGALSPDGRWLAYTSDNSGRFEIYVQSFPEPGTRIQVSPNGGNSARWRRDGKELYYETPDGTLTVVPVRSGQPIEFGPPVALFQFFDPQRGAPGQRPNYDVTADGQRFIVSAIERRTDPSLYVLLNWPSLVAATKP